MRRFLSAVRSARPSCPSGFMSISFCACGAWRVAGRVAPGARARCCGRQAADLIPVGRQADALPSASAAGRPSL